MEYNSGKYLKLSEMLSNDGNIENKVPLFNSLEAGNDSTYVFKTSNVSIDDETLTGQSTNLRYLTLRHNNNITGLPSQCNIFYGVSNTPASTATKVVTIKTDVNTTPETLNNRIHQKGTILFVTFLNTNSAAVGNLALNVNSVGAKKIRAQYNNTVAGASTGYLINAGELQKDRTYMFTYDGTYWVCMTTNYDTTSSSGATVSSSGGSTTQYYLVGTTSTGTGGTTLYRYGTSGPWMKGVDLYTGSDINYKTDITPISDDFVNQLFDKTDITYDFKWKDTNKDSSGFIAQWIEDIMPEVVDGDDNQKHVNYNAALSKVVGAMFKKIQEQQKEINELKTIIKQKEGA